MLKLFLFGKVLDTIAGLRIYRDLALSRRLSAENADVPRDRAIAGLSGPSEVQCSQCSLERQEYLDFP